LQEEKEKEEREGADQGFDEEIKKMDMR